MAVYIVANHIGEQVMEFEEQYKVEFKKLSQ